MNDTRGPAKVPSKKTSFPPGDYLPRVAHFPGQTAVSILGWVIGLPLGAFLGAGAATVMFGNVQQGSLGALVGMGITYMIVKDVQKSILLKRGRKHYSTACRGEPHNADACVQAGLWIHENVKTLQEIEEGDGYYRKALECSLGHRDATVALAMSLSAANSLRPADHRAAVELLEPWLAQHEDFNAEVLMAEALKALGEHKEAAEHYRRILELHPETPMRGQTEQYLREHDAVTSD